MTLSQGLHSNVYSAERPEYLRETGLGSGSSIQTSAKEAFSAHD